MNPAIAGFVGGIMGAMAVGGALSAPALVRGADMDATALSDRVGILEERVAYLEQSVTDQAGGSDVTMAWLTRCIKTQPAAWARSDGRAVLAARSDAQARIWFAVVSPKCLAGP